MSSSLYPCLRNASRLLRTMSMTYLGRTIWQYALRVFMVETRLPLETLCTAAYTPKLPKSMISPYLGQTSAGRSRQHSIRAAPAAKGVSVKSKRINSASRTRSSRGSALAYSGGTMPSVLNRGISMGADHTAPTHNERLHKAGLLQ